MKCPYCGTEYVGSYCPNCGSNNKDFKREEPKVEQKKEEEESVQPKVTIQTNDQRPQRSKTVMAILSLLFGTIGLQYFYIGKISRGIACILFCWTGIPTIVGLIEALILLTEDTSSFEFRYKVRNMDEDAK